VCHAGVRGTGLGRALVAEGLRGCERQWPGQPNRISAQAHLGRFYGEFGYQPVGEVYLEDDIPHLQMRRPGRMG
jgi:ElaA protein